MVFMTSELVDPVRNFIVFYVVITAENKKIMEVWRFLYKRQDRDNLI